MRMPPLSRWPDDLANHEGLLFFAQRVEESLFDFSLDSYKAPALNTYSRARELRFALGEVEREGLGNAVLAPMIEELADSIDNDRAAQKAIGPSSERLRRTAEWQEGGLRELEARLDLVLGALNHSYEATLRRMLAAKIPEGREKKDIQTLAMALARQWEEKGFSSDYIFWRTRQFFFSRYGRPIDRPGVLQEYFSHFDREAREYTVLFRGSASFSALADQDFPGAFDILNEAPDPRTASNKEREFLQSGHHGVYLRTSVEALDARTARRHASTKIEAFVDVAGVHTHRQAFDWWDDALVYSGEGEPRVLRKSVSPIEKYSEPPTSQLGARIRATMVAFASIGRLSREWDQFINAFHLHSAALRSEAVEAQFLMIWSAFESLLPLSEATVRINKIVDVTVPILSLFYAQKLIEDVLQDVTKCIPDAKDEVFQELPTEWDDLEKMAAVLTIDESRPYREVMYAACDPGNPLLKFRIMELNGKLSGAAALRETIGKHARRVEWQLHRIYRSRNLLVHSAATLPYVEAITENLHAYFHQLLQAIEGVCTAPPVPPGIPEAIIVARMSHKQHLEVLDRRKAEACTVENFRSIVFSTSRST